jgi:membrane protein DedA with SNARE-associated domain
MDWHAKLLGLFLVLVGGGVGLPFPEDLTLIGAGVLVEQRVFHLREVIVVGLAGVAVADWTLYLFGRRYGAALIERRGVVRLLGGQRIEAVRKAVLRHGATAVFLARFMFGFRIATFLSAGMFGVSIARFAIAEAAALLIFVPAIVTLGLLSAHQAERVLANVNRVEHWLILAGLLGLVLFLVLRAWAARDLAVAETPAEPPAHADAEAPRPRNDASSMDPRP